MPTINLPTKGPDPRREDFFDQLREAYAFLAGWYTLEADQQEQLLGLINKLFIEAKARQKRR